MLQETFIPLHLFTRSFVVNAGQHDKASNTINNKFQNKLLTTVTVNLRDFDGLESTFR